jgi:hypothetical protein
MSRQAAQLSFNRPWLFPSARQLAWAGARSAGLIFGIQGFVKITYLAFWSLLIKSQLHFAAAISAGLAPADPAAVRVGGATPLFAALLEFPTLHFYLTHGFTPCFGGVAKPL